MALDTQLLTSQAHRKQPNATSLGAMSRVPGYTTGLSPLGSTRRAGGPVGPNPLPKKIGALGRARAKPVGSPRGLAVGVSASSMRVGRASNATDSSSQSPKAFDRNLNNVKPIKEIRRGETHAHNNDAKQESPSSSAHSEDSKRNLPPALSMDFIKHALSSNKQIYSPQEIKQKAETSWKSSNKQVTKRPKTKTVTPRESTEASQQKASSNSETPNSKLIESMRTEGFGPRVKSKELNAQLKQLHRRLGGDNAIKEEPEEHATAASVTSHVPHTR